MGCGRGFHTPGTPAAPVGVSMAPGMPPAWGGPGRKNPAGSAAKVDAWSEVDVTCVKSLWLSLVGVEIPEAWGYTGTSLIRNTHPRRIIIDP